MADTQAPQTPLAGLKARLGEVFDEIFALGRKAGREEGYKAGFAEGSRIERERIRGVLEQALPGHQALSEQLAPEGGTGTPASTPTAPVAPGTPKPKSTGTLSKIKQVLAAETAKAADLLSELTGDKPRQPLPPSADPVAQATAAPALSLEERCKADWEREPGLRAEYGTLEAYLAFSRQSEGGGGGIL